MSHLARSRLLVTLTLAMLMLVTASCGPFDATVTNDPCLLQQYQSHSYSVLGHLQSSYSTLAGRLDALQAPHYTISASPDISATLFALSEFETGLEQQRYNLTNTLQPPPSLGQEFAQQTRSAMSLFDTGARLLAAAYVDAGDGNTHEAQAVSTTALTWMRQALLLLDQASLSLYKLHTYSNNC